MLRDIMHILSNNLNDIGLFTKIYPLVEKIKRGDRTYPANFIGAGQAEEIKYDSTLGMCYFRKNGKVSTSTVKVQSLTSCEDNINYLIRTPLKLVCFIPKSKAECDDAFTDDEFAERIIKEISTTGISDNLPVESSQLIASGYETSGITVLSEEYSNPPTDINYNFSYFSIEFNLEIVVDKKCLHYCNGYY